MCSPNYNKCLPITCTETFNLDSFINCAFVSVFPKYMYVLVKVTSYIFGADAFNVVFLVLYQKVADYLVACCIQIFILRDKCSAACHQFAIF